MSSFPRLKKQLTKDQLYCFRDRTLIFFNKEIVENIHHWDILITVHRKGEFVFKDLISDFTLPTSVLIISDYQIPEYKNYFEKKNVLLFDDSINKTETIQNMIDEIINYNINSLSVATLLANKSTYQMLVEKNKDIQFIVHKVSSNYQEYFLTFMCPYFDYICLPATKDLIVEKITIFRKLSDLEVTKLLTTKDFNLEEKSLFHYEDRFKLMLDFFNETYNSSVFFSDLPFYGFSNLNLSQIKVRLFVHLFNTVTRIYVEYVVEPVRPNFSTCTKKFKRMWCLQENAEKTDCLRCLQYNLTEYLKRYIRTPFDSLKTPYHIDSLPWVFCGFLVSTEM